ncbi:MAG: hypothetical protein QXG05_07985 [Nitrososphaerota archaeon]
MMYSVYKDQHGCLMVTSWLRWAGGCSAAFPIWDIIDRFSFDGNAEEALEYAKRRIEMHENDII